MSSVTVITGPTSGLGLSLVRQLASQPEENLVLVARNAAQATALAEDLARRAGREVATVIQADLSSLASTVAAGRQISQRWGGRITGLVNNAGLQLRQVGQRSPDGYELTFAVNHLAAFTLTEALLPALAPAARVVFLSSGTHDPADKGAARFGFRGARYVGAEAVARGALGEGGSSVAGQDEYATSKFCNIVTSFAYARRYPAARASFFAFDPGLMPGTGLAREASAILWFAWKVILPVIARLMPGASTTARSAAALAWLLRTPSLEGKTGLHLDFTRRETPVSDDARELAKGDELFTWSRAALAPFFENKEGAGAARGVSRAG